MAKNKIQTIDLTEEQLATKTEGPKLKKKAQKQR